MLMRHRLFFLLAACGLSPAAVGAEEATERFPLSVRVTADHTYLRAGPSDDFYPTARLLRDDTVEVWAIDPAGYCAVRPVQGSFSWLRAADLDDEAALDDAAPDKTRVDRLGTESLILGRRALGGEPQPFPQGGKVPRFTRS